MANYNLLQTVSGTSHPGMCGDAAGNLYVLARAVAGNTYKVYQYDIGAALLIDISGANLNLWGTGQGDDIAWFDGGLYVAIGVDANTVGVYKWAGSGQVWSQVDTVNIGLGTLTNTYLYLEADSERIVWVACNVAPAQHHFRASTNGAAWGNQSSSFNFVTRLYYNADLGVVVGEDDGDVLGMNTIYHSTGANWAAINASPIDTKYAIAGMVRDYQFYTDSSLPEATTLQRTQDYGITVVGAGMNYNSWSSAVHPKIHLLGNTGVAISVKTGQTGRVYFWDEGTLTWSSDGIIGGDLAANGKDPVRYGDTMYLLRSGTGIYVRDTALPPIGYKAYSVGGLAPMDVSADSYYLHVGTLISGNPELLRLLTDLSADPTRVYTPGAGSAINVRCGRLNEGWVWIAGDFGGPLVRASIDDGTTWVTKDPGTWAGVAQPIVLGPDDDNLVLVATDGDDDLHETEDGGLNWATLNAGLPFDVGGMDRLDINLDEIVIGNIAGAADNVEYSPSNGGEFNDITGALPATAITDVIVG